MGIFSRKAFTPDTRPITFSKLSVPGEDVQFKQKERHGWRHTITGIYAAFRERHVGLLSIRVGGGVPMQFYVHNQRDIPLTVEANEGEEVIVYLSSNTTTANISSSLVVIGQSQKCP